MTAPTITTERLVLRGWNEGDLEPFARLNADPVVMEHIGDLLTREESDAFARTQEQHFTEHGFGLWAVEVTEGRATSISQAAARLAETYGWVAESAKKWVRVAAYFEECPVLWLVPQANHSALTKAVFRWSVLYNQLRAAPGRVALLRANRHALECDVSLSAGHHETLAAVLNRCNIPYSPTGLPGLGPPTAAPVPAVEDPFAYLTFPPVESEEPLYPFLLPENL